MEFINFNNKVSNFIIASIVTIIIATTNITVTWNFIASFAWIALVSYYTISSLSLSPELNLVIIIIFNAMFKYPLFFNILLIFCQISNRN